MIESERQLDLFDAPIPNVVTRLTFNQAIRLFNELYWSSKRMHRDTQCFIRYLTVYFDGRFIETLGRQDVQGMRRHMETVRLLGPSGVNKCHMIFTRMYNVLEEWKEDGWAGGYDFSDLKIPRRNPGQLVRRAPEPPGDRYITPWEARILRRIAHQIGDEDLADRILMGIWCRLSPIDLGELNDDEIKSDRWQIEVRRRHTITDQNPRGVLQVIPLKEKIWALIERRRRSRKEGDKKIFNNRNLRRRVARLRRAGRAQGIPDFTLRDLRRSGSGALHEKGFSLEDRADGMGHTTPRVTKSNYTPPTRPHLRKQVEALIDTF